jgi:REP element-mobilizing transposase RayT
LKSYTAKQILYELESDSQFSVLNLLNQRKASYKKESEYQVWQEGYHPQEMSNNLILKQKIEYIHYNPVRKGYVETPEDWKYSSARYYALSEENDLKITRYD